MENKIRVINEKKPYSVPIEMRPLWRICLIVVCVLCVSQDKKYLNLKKVNILVWILIRKKMWSEYEDYLLGRSSKVPLISVDTATYKAIEISIAKGILNLERDRLYVASAGDNLFKTIMENEIMAEEISFLNSVGSKLSESKIKEMTGRN
ncbi:hypothetical protein [Cellvibrio fibrivorans]|uniref:Uncharacterized protein n=1 Tax=Cellvibrio fibrivorans TaxID=126350 RepID=A0ABU1UTS7_9GAMM|nr:hypothetical protein [Cellvibrio fibrivorans]MDR7088592.1 hypothetical protein [Cellvibrio fibrivorans]